MSQMDYSRQGCKHLRFVQMGTIAAFGYVCCFCVWVREKVGGGGKRGVNKLMCQPLCLNRLLSLGGECQVGPP